MPHIPAPYWTPAVEKSRKGAPPAQGLLLNMREMAEHHQITSNRETTFANTYFVMEAAYLRQAMAMRAGGEDVPWIMPVQVDGHTVKCGYQSYNTRNSFGVALEDADKALAIRALRTERLKPSMHRVKDNDNGPAR